MRNYKLFTPKIRQPLKNNRDDLFQVIFEDSPDAIFLLHVDDFVIIDCNVKALQLFQAPDKAELTGRDSFSLYESEPVEFSKSTFIETIGKGEEHSQELTFRSLKGNIFWGRCSIRQVMTADGPIVVFRVRRVVDYMKTAEMLSSMIKHTSKATGYKYFSVLTELLAKTFGVCTAMIAKIDTAAGTATAVHCWHRTGKIENMTFALETSPALNVTRGYPTFYPRNLKEMFAQDPLIRTLEAEGFLGTPVFCAEGNVCGLLLLMDDKPMEEIPNSRNILSLFASRAGAEFERIQTEENYRQKIRELETK
ncbi:MAG TPA: PAS domain-containing protein [Bacteroidales bacterium]|jgi:PAS domain S-box-containing protein|nr:PAS domain-containing protein [Bacteroidales bacterium]